ncbi:MAG: glycosyltransferase family 2 protein [Telluria sp.]
MRDDALLNSAIEAFEAGHYADALVAVEYVCRLHPSNSIPAILRAKILQACRPELSPKAWYRAWCCDPENAALQDVMLRAWLDSGARASVADLGPAFLPARCKSGTHATLLALLHEAGVNHAGSCWKAGDAIEAMIFSAGAQRVRLLLSDGVDTIEYEVPAGGTHFRLPCPRPAGVWSLAFKPPGEAQPRLMHGSPLVFRHAPGAQPARAPAGDKQRPVSVVIPVYRDMRLVQACIDSVLASLPLNAARAELVVIDDASPEPELSAWLDELAATGSITLLRNEHNLGFIETVNRGMRHHAGHDVLLLNADTLVYGDWIDRLCAALYSAPDIASVTPWSNNGEISSFPKIATAVTAPNAAQLAEVDTVAAQLRRLGATADVELPSCCGFTMLIRRAVLDEIGMLDGVALVRGYGEEVDWCLRAGAAGYRHLAATGVFVAHAGTVSFRFEKTLRVRQNRNVLAARYPHYHPEYRAFISDDPLGAARAALSEALQAEGPGWIDGALGLIDGDTDLARTLPAALASSCTRIAVWQLRAGACGSDKILALARLLASRGPDAPRIRLLVIGEATDALWRTGVVDVVPSSVWQEGTLLTDAALMGLASCSVLLGAKETTAALGLPHIVVDDAFDPAAWLSGFTARPTLKKMATA